MSAVEICSIVFVCVFGGALAGIALRAILPAQHLSPDSKNAVTVAMGMVATLAALVLGLLVGSAKGSFDAQTNAITNISAQMIMADRVLSHYGPETKPIRADLHAMAVRFLERTWSKAKPATQVTAAGKGPSGEPSAAQPRVGGAEVLLDEIESLTPKTDEQRQIRARSYDMVLSLGQTRWLMYEERSIGVSITMLSILVFWLTAIFVSFGLFAPTNPTVVSAFAVAAFSVSAAILMILEMYQPYTGLIQVSSAPVRAALVVMGQ